MTALILVYDNEGRKIAQCDAKCYDANGGRCRCICAGRNHGVGRQQAAANTQVMSESEMDKEEVAPGRNDIAIKKAARLADMAHPTFFDVR